MLVANVQKGNAYRKVADMMKVNFKTVARITTKYKATKSVTDLHRTDRPRLTTSKQDRLLVRMYLKDRRLTASNIRQKLLQGHEIDLAARTV